MIGFPLASQATIFKITGSPSFSPFPGVDGGLPGTFVYGGLFGL